MSARSRCSAALVLGTIALMACGGGDGGTTQPQPAAVSSVTVSLASGTAVVGATVQATAVTKDASGATLTGRTVTWSSSNTAVATVVSSSGLATAVAPGTTNLIATSEGVSGQSALTVNAPAPTLTGLTLNDPNGGALDVSKLAGTVRLSFNLQATAGTSGVVVVKIDGVEMTRQNVTATIVQPDAATTTSAAMQTPVTVDVNTSQVAYTINNNLIQALPLARNGNRVLMLEYIPGGSTTPAATTQTNVTLSTPDVFTGRILRSGTLTNLGGDDWSSGDISIELIPIQYSGNAPSSAVLKLTDFKPTLGGAQLTGVVDLVTKTSSDIASPALFPKTSFAFESKPQVGWRTYLSDYGFGSLHTMPQSAEPNLNGNCVYTAGTGFIPSTAGTLPALPSGCTRWVSINPLPSSFTSSPLVDAFGKWLHDTKGPTAAAGAFTLNTRPTIAGQSAFGTSGTFGVSDNWIGAGYNFSLGLDKTKLSDGGVGYNLNQTYEYHFGTTPSFTPSVSSLISNIDLVPETGGQRLNYFKVGARDLLGNIGYAPLTTSLGNAFTTGGATSTNFGVDPALVGINRNGGFASYSGPASGFVVRGGFGSVTWGATLTGSPAGYTPNASAWSRIYRDGDPSKSVIGEGVTTQIPWWQGGTGGASATSSLSYSSMISASIAKYGGNGEGMYTATFGALDRGGTVPPGAAWGPINTLYDITPPTTPTFTGNGPFISGQSATISVGAFDNIGLSWYSIGPIFNFPNAGFAGGFAYVVPGQIPIGGAFGGPMTKTWTQDITDVVPNGMVFYDGLSGSLGGVVNKTIGIAGYSRDWAWNESPVVTKTFTNNGTFSVPGDPLAIHFSVGTTTACNGTACAGGVSNLMGVTASWDSPSMTNPLSKWEIYALSQDGRVHFLETAPAAVRTSIPGNLFRYTTTFNYDWNEYCSQGGNLQLIGLGQSLNRLYWYKNNPFYPLALVQPLTPNTYCQAAYVG